MIKKIKAVGRAHWAIGLILITFIGLGVTYSLVTPIFEAPDEGGHYRYINYLAEKGSLPVVEGAENPVGHEVWQPPLYYALGALVTFKIDTSDMEKLEWHNPHWGLFGSKNVVYHTSDESFPYRSTALAVHIVRLLSILMGGVTVAITYLLVLELFPDQRWMALGAAAVNAFNPQFVFIGGAINNDNLVTPLCSIILLTLLRLAKNGLRAKDLVSLGILLGFAALTKVSALAFIPLVVAILCFYSLGKRSFTLFIARSLVVLGLCALISGWWFLRNWSLYGDPLAWWAMLSSSIPLLRVEPLSGLALFRYAGWLRRSFWAVFGYGILVHPLIYRCLDIVVLLGFLGFAIFVARRWHRRELDWKVPSALAILLLWLAVILFSLLRWMQILEATNQGRLLFPAISAISVLLSVGLSQLAPRPYRWVPSSVFVVGLFILAAVSPFLYIVPAYARPRALRIADLQAIQHPTYLRLGNEVELLGYEIDRTVVKPGEKVRVAFYWHALGKMDQSYVVFVHLLGRDGKMVGQEDSIPYGGRYSTLLWEEGEVFRDEYEITVSHTAEPSLGIIEVGMYPWWDPSDRLPISNEEGDLLGDSFRLLPFKIAPLTKESYQIENPRQVNLGDKVTFLGYELDEGIINPGETIHLVFYWQAQEEMDRDYTVFTHLLDAKSQIWAQEDSQPQKGDYPTSIWDEGEMIRDEYELEVGLATPPGDYLIEVGIYLLETGERLPVLEEGRVVSDRILLEDKVVVLP